MSPHRNTTPQPGMARVIDARGPAIVRAWRSLLEAHPDLKQQEEMIGRDEIVIRQGDDYALAVMILEGSVREEMSIEDGNASRTVCLRKVDAGRIVFVEAILETSSASARYSIITETPATIVRIDRGWLREMGMLPAKGGLEFSLVDDLVRGRSEELDVIELALVNLLMEEKEAEKNLAALVATQQSATEELEGVQQERDLANSVYEGMRNELATARKELASARSEIEHLRVENETNHTRLVETTQEHWAIQEELRKLAQMSVPPDGETIVEISDDEITFVTESLMPATPPSDAPEIEVRFSIVPTEQASSVSPGERSNRPRDTIPGMPAFAPPPVTPTTEEEKPVARNNTINWQPGEINRPMSLDPNRRPPGVRVSLTEEKK